MRLFLVLILRIHSLFYCDLLHNNIYIKCSSSEHNRITVIIIIMHRLLGVLLLIYMNKTIKIRAVSLTVVVSKGYSKFSK